MSYGHATGCNLLTSPRVLVTWFLMVLGSALPAIGHGESKTVCDGGCDYTTIKEATMNTNLGDTILVRTAKTYNESDIVVSGKVLISEGGPEGYIINGSGCSEKVIVTGSGGVVEGFTITGCSKTSGSNGAGIISGGDTLLNNVVIKGNSTTGNYAGIWHNGGGTLTIRNSEIKDNIAASMPAFSSVAANLKIFGLKITGNTATGPSSSGTVGTARQLGLTAHIVDLELSSNTVNGRTVAGGGLFISCNNGSRKASIFSSEIKNNISTGTNDARGGGIYINGCETDIVATEVSGNVLTNTGGISRGGGFYTSTSARDVRLFAGSSVTGNSADSGGGVWCSNGRWQVSGSITANTQTDTDFVNGNGACQDSEEVGISAPESGTSGDPVNTLTGELFDILPPDIALGGPLPLEFARFYNSSYEANGYKGTLGRNWLHNFEYFFEAVTADNIKIFAPDGQLIQFYRNADEDWIRYAPSQVYFQLTEEANTFVLYNPNNRLFYTFDKTTSLLDSISDSNGNTHTLTYTTGNLSEVADGLGRTLSFSYVNDVMERVSGGDKTISFTQNISRELMSVRNERGGLTTHSYKSIPDGLLEMTTRPELNVPFKQTWDSSNRVATQTDALFNEFIFSYDGSGTTTITNPDNDTTSHTHDGAGVLVQAEDEEGNAITITADDENRRSDISNALGNNTLITYDDVSGYATEVKDGEGNIFKFTYEPRILANGIVEHDLVRADYPDGSFETWEFDDFGNYTTYADAGGHDWVYTYDAMGNVLTETNPASGVTTYTYLPDGNLDTVKDPAGNVIDHDYDDEWRLVLTKLPDTNERSFSYDENDNLLIRTDENGVDLERQYDMNDNRTRTSDGAVTGVSMSYDGMDRLSGLTPPEGNPATITYDSFGRIATLTGPDGNALTYSYDSRGRLTSLDDNAGNVWMATFDDAGRKISEKNALGHTTTFAYDGADRLIQLVDPEGTVHDLEYDGMDRIISSTVGGRTTSFSYEGRGLVEDFTIAPGIDTQVVYNELGRIEQVTDATGNNWSFTHDSSGRTVTSVDPLSRTTSYEFDNRNRHNKTIFPSAMGTLDIGYDGHGQIKTMQYSDGVNLAYDYDDMGGLTASNDVALTRDKLGRVLNSNGIVNTYDPEGGLGKTSLSGGDIDYGYDIRGQLTSVDDWLGGNTSFNYDDAGRLLSITHSNGLSTIYTYNKVNSITSIEVRDGATVISRNDFTRDSLGQITSASRAYPAGTPGLNLTPGATSFGFDVAMQTQGFGHDDMGRRTSDDMHQYTWSLASRLDQYTADGGSTTVDLAYDGLGHVISRNDGGGAQTFTWNYATTHPCVAEMTGRDVRYNVCAPDGRLLYSITTADDRRVYHYDEMGNVQFVTNNAGDVLAAYRYSPFGQVLVDSSNGSLDNPFTYQGQSGVLTERDDLYLFQSRAYDGRGGRFLSRDPVSGFDPVTVNPYQYAMNNPLLFIDPDGMDSVKAEDVFSGGAGVFSALVDHFTPGSIAKLHNSAMAGGFTPKALQQAKSAANAKRLSGGLSHVGAAAWAYSAWQEIKSTNDKFSQARNQHDIQLMHLLKSYSDNLKTVTDFYKQKKITYHRWRAWVDILERQLKDGIDSSTSSTQLEIAQDTVEGLLKAVGSVIVPPSAIDCMMKWMGQNVPPNDVISGGLTDLTSN